LAGIETIVAGGWYTVALNKQNQVWVWGGNWYGQMRLGNIDNESTPRRVNLPGIKQVAAGEWHTVALDKEGYLWSWGSNERVQLVDGSIGEGVYKSIPQRVDLVNIVVN